MCPLSVSFSLSPAMSPSCADKSELRRLFPACAWHRLPLSEAKADLLPVGGCFPLVWHGPTHLPDREVFPGCFSFLPGEFFGWPGCARPRAGCSPNGRIYSSVMPAGCCQLANAGQRFTPKRMLCGFLRLARKNARQDLDRGLPAEHLGGLVAIKQAMCWVLVCYLAPARY